MVVPPKVLVILLVAALVAFGVGVAFALGDDYEDADIEDEEIGTSTLHIKSVTILASGTELVLTKDFDWFDMGFLTDRGREIQSMYYVAEFTPSVDMELVGFPDAASTVLTVQTTDLADGSVKTLREVRQPSSINARAGERYTLLSMVIIEDDFVQYNYLPGDYKITYILDLSVMIDGVMKGWKITYPSWNIGFTVATPPGDGDNGEEPPPPGNGGGCTPRTCGILIFEREIDMKPVVEVTM